MSEAACVYYGSCPDPGGPAVAPRITPAALSTSYPKQGTQTLSSRIGIPTALIGCAAQPSQPPQRPSATWTGQMCRSFALAFHWYVGSKRCYQQQPTTSRCACPRPYSLGCLRTRSHRSVAQTGTLSTLSVSVASHCTLPDIILLAAWASPSSL